MRALGRWGASHGHGARPGHRVARLALVLASASWPAGALAQHETRPASGTARDWEIAREQVAWGLDQGLDTASEFGEVVAAVGLRFLGTDYEPGTLELPGPERLVINLETLDCVTFVENVLALSRLVRAAPREVVGDAERFRAAYRKELTRIRYRNGALDGYASRLHYFSEWIADADAKGVVTDVSQALGGTRDDSPIDFMSTHPDAYRQLADPGALARIAVVEARLSRVARFYVPADEIEAKAGLIRTGDVVAATSTVPGLDVAHTGIAVWRDGTLRLLHAPLVGSHVQLSQETIAERIRRIGGQDGIMVARPVDPAALPRSARGTGDGGPTAHGAPLPQRTLGARFRNDG